MKLLILMFISIFAFANEVFFMPFEGKKAENRLYYLFTHAHKNIKIIMYSFTNKKLSHALKIASKHNVKITIIADKKESKFHRSVIPNLAAIKNIKIYLLSGNRYSHSKDRGKLHAKVSIIDGKILVTGSANYTYSAFYKNYEYIILNNNNNLITKFEKFFNILKEKATPYRLSR